LDFPTAMQYDSHKPRQGTALLGSFTGRHMTTVLKGTVVQTPVALTLQFDQYNLAPPITTLLFITVF